MDICLQGQKKRLDPIELRERNFFFSFFAVSIDASQSNKSNDITLAQNGGNNNYAVVNQTGNGSRTNNIVGLTQTGNNLVANVSQTGGAGNVATILQH